MAVSRAPAGRSRGKPPRYPNPGKHAANILSSIDTVGVHYSGTLWRWYRNWLGNADAVTAKFGKRWYRIWELFLAWSTIASRQGSATCYQMVVVKNLNATHRINGFGSQFGLSGALAKARAAGKAVFPKSK